MWALKRRDDAGAALIMAMIVTLILATLSLAALARTLSSMSSMRHAQDYEAALAAADAAVADALHHIDQTATPRVAAATFERSGTVGAGTYRYRALKRSEREYELLAVGTVGSSRHGIRARIIRSVKFPFALFSNQDLVFDGNSNANIYSFDASGVRTGEARVGSNHQVVVGSGKGAGDEQHYYAPYGGCSGCPKPFPHPEEENDIAPVKAPTGAVRPCPAGGTFSGTIDGAGGVPVVCRTSVTFTGEVRVTNPPLVVYVLPADDTASAAQSALDISGAIVNPSGRATDVQIFKAGSAPLLIGNGNTSNTMSFNGIMYAPESTVEVNGGKSWRGSWVIDALNVNGGPNIHLGYDLDTRTYYGNDWRVSRYDEIPSATKMSDGWSAAP